MVYSTVKKCNSGKSFLQHESSSLKQVKLHFDIYQSTLWFNENISKEIIFFPKWAIHGISIVGDVITSELAILSREQIAQTYYFNVNILEYFRIKSPLNFNVNILEYFRKKSPLKKFISKYSSGGAFDMPRPHVPFHMQTVLQSQGRSKEFYNYLTKETNEATRKCK